MIDCGYAGSAVCGRRRCRCDTCVGKISVYNRAYAKENGAEYREKNRLQIAARSKIYQEKNRGRIREAHRAYHAALWDPCVYLMRATSRSEGGVDVAQTKVGRAKSLVHRVIQYRAKGHGASSKREMLYFEDNPLHFNVADVPTMNAAEHWILFRLWEIGITPVYGEEWFDYKDHDKIMAVMAEAEERFGVEK